jgi:hypothetical protein
MQQIELGTFTMAGLPPVLTSQIVRDISIYQQTIHSDATTESKKSPPAAAEKPPSTKPPASDQQTIDSDAAESKKSPHLLQALQK